MATAEKKYRYQIIADKLRKEIDSHRCAGEFLETTAFLSKRFCVNPRTVDKAMDILCSEGRISRAAGRGTVVSDPLATGGFVMYLDTSLLAPGASLFYRMTCQALSNMLHEFNPRWHTRMYLWPTNPKASIGVENSLASDVYDKRTRGIFSFISTDTLPEELSNSTIPVVWLSCWAGEHRVYPDHSVVFREALKHFRDAGCRKVGLIWSNSEQRAQAGILEDEMFCEEARANGIETRKEWMPASQNEESEQEGYNLFRTLWEQNDRPDGLLVLDDFLCRGVLAAIRDFGVDVPNDLSLVSLGNRGSPIPYKKTITTVEVDHVETARALLNMMVALVRGEKLDKDIVLVPPKLRVGDTVRKQSVQSSNTSKEVSSV